MSASSGGALRCGRHCRVYGRSRYNARQLRTYLVSDVVIPARCQRRAEVTLDQLETFVQVARARSFSRAAILLDLAQPTLSGRIAALESELGAQLFERHGHTLALTEAGRTLLPYAERMQAL